MNRKIFWVFIFGITMGFFEASVVVYLRALFYPEGFRFPIKYMPEYQTLMVVEILRELSSIFMMVSVAALVDASFSIKFAFFGFVFGVWDLVYYLVLKLALGWPMTLGEWDLLFLLPLPWAGPVWAPCIVSVTLIFGALFLIKQWDRGIIYLIKPGDWLFMILSGMLVVISFLWEYKAIISSNVPTIFPWYIFAAGEAAAVIYLVYVVRVRKHAREIAPGNR